MINYLLVYFCMLRPEHQSSQYNSIHVDHTLSFDSWNHKPPLNYKSRKRVLTIVSLCSNSSNFCLRHAVATADAHRIDPKRSTEATALRAPSLSSTLCTVPGPATPCCNVLCRDGTARALRVSRHSESQRGHSELDGRHSRRRTDRNHRRCAPRPLGDLSWP